jgi:hypothetical protein
MENEMRRPLFVQIGGLVLIIFMLIGFALGCMVLMVPFVLMAITAWILTKLKLL